MVQCPDSAPPTPTLCPQIMRRRNVVLALVAMVLVLIIIGLCLGLSFTSRRPKHVYSKAAVAADAKQCSEIGR